MNTQNIATSHDTPLIAAPILPLRECRDNALVGGKATNLGELIRAGFDVPDGFVVTTSAYRAAHASEAAAQAVAAEAALAYERMGGGPVAVRSSATAEDMAGASMAGQYETFLDVRSADDLIDRITKCWASLDTPRTRAYLAEQGIAMDRVAMAVVVQRLVAADVAGVLFTVNPRTGDESQMSLEASWGLGEAVVSGEVQPDMLTLDRADGRVLEAHIADKRVQVDPATGHAAEVAPAHRLKACLDSKIVHTLWQVGRQSEAHFGRPQDMEWAVANGRLYVLQSRAITTTGPHRQRRAALDEARALITAALSIGRGPWVPHNISETLSCPTPLTWGVIQHFLSGGGGFGELYRRVGFQPAPLVQNEGFADLIGGRIYMDLSRAPEMFFENFPFAYDPERLRGDPQAGQSPPTLPRGTIGQRVSIGRRLGAIHRNIAELAGPLDTQLETTAIPEMIAWVQAERAIDMQALDNDALAATWERRRARVMDVFAPESLLPGLIVGQAQADLAAMLAEHVWDQDAQALARSLSSGGKADETTRASQELFEVGKGTRTLEAWLERHGHRAPEEMDLAAPRWRERPHDVLRLAERLADGADPAARYQEQHAASLAHAASLRATLPQPARKAFDDLLGQLRRYVPYRENGKFYLMLGYETLRSVALEAGRRLGIGDDVFYLTPPELTACLKNGFAPLHVLGERRVHHAAQRVLGLPELIDEASIATLGVPADFALPAADETDGSRRGFAISPGIGVGEAYVTDDPTDPLAPKSGYVLVCRTTDPSWTPLFIGAVGVVLETGGALSHGAIVAREMGVPAVVVADARRLFPTGTKLTVNGHAGLVFTVDKAVAAADASAADDIHLSPSAWPPPSSAKERSTAHWRNVWAGGWLVVMALAWLLPSRWLFDPALRVLDVLLWPIVRTLGPRLATAAIAAGLAVLTMGLQRVLTDNARLRVAKQRAAVLKHDAAALPAGSPRKAVLTAAAAPVQARVVGAAMVPVGLLLGPLVMIFLWLPERVDPAVTPPPAGARVIIKAVIDGESTAAVTLWGDRLSPQGLGMQSVPPIRQALEALRAEWVATPPPMALPWDVAAAGRAARQQMLASLDSYLAGSVPPQTLAWTLKLPDEPGIYLAQLTANGISPIRIKLACGERTLPQRKSIPGNGAVRSVEIANPPKLRQDLAFFRPFTRLGWHWEAGWLGLYLMGYVPAMVIARFILNVA